MTRTRLRPWSAGSRRSVLPRENSALLRIGACPLGAGSGRGKAGVGARFSTRVRPGPTRPGAAAQTRASGRAGAAALRRGRAAGQMTGSHSRVRARASFPGPDQIKTETRAAFLAFRPAARLCLTSLVVYLFGPAVPAGRPMTGCSIRRIKGNQSHERALFPYGTFV